MNHPAPHPRIQQNQRRPNCWFLAVWAAAGALSLLVSGCGSSPHSTATAGSPLGYRVEGGVDIGWHTTVSHVDGAESATAAPT